MQPSPGSITAAVRRRFVETNLHDCRLLGIAVARSRASESDVVTLSLELLDGAKADWLPARLEFLGCAGMSLELDFWGKAVCDDAIADTSCEALSDHSASLLDQNPRRLANQPLKSLSVFTITLCPPGGQLRVIATDFALTTSTTHG